MKTRKLIIEILTDEFGHQQIRMFPDVDSHFDTTEVIGVLEWCKLEFANINAQKGKDDIAKLHFNRANALDIKKQISDIIEKEQSKESNS